jgi:hypothetical protein
MMPALPANSRCENAPSKIEAARLAAAPFDQFSTTVKEHAHDSTWIAQLCLRTISKTGGFGEETLDEKEMGERRTAGECSRCSGHYTPSPAARAAEPYKAPRTADGKADLNGVWQAVNTANWDLQEHVARTGLVVALGAVGAEPGGLGVVEGGEIPYLPEAAAKKKANFENRLTDDPEIKCYLPGVPRATYMPYPFQIIQTSKDITLL